MKLIYKNIHIGAIATFYIVALILRLITLFIGNKYPELRGDYAFQLSTGLGPIIGAFVAMAIFKRKTEYTLFGKSVWKSVATIAIPCAVFGIIGGLDTGILCLPHHYSDVASMASGFGSTKPIGILPTLTVRLMGNW